ncbi:MAG: hypothetical protein AB7M05_20830 [Alphaproteobacteria bacterium]
MDSLTHVYLAHKLLMVCGGKPSAAVCSLFPQIDREPAYLHRMYAHPFFQIRELASIGTHVYDVGEAPAGCRNEYAAERFVKDRPRMKRFVEAFQSETGERLGPLEESNQSVLMAYASHTYQDIFNNPMQGFLPVSVYPCGKWELWEKLDAIEFRTRLYEPERIVAFRSEYFADPLWNNRFGDPLLMIRAMVRRTAAASAVRLDGNAVDRAIEAIGADQGGGDDRVADDFFETHEVLLSALIRKYGGRTGDSSRSALVTDS